MVGRLFNAIFAQLNKVVGWFVSRDPIAIMRYEFEKNRTALKEGKEGLVQYRALTEKFGRDVALKEQQRANTEAKVKAFLKIENRAGAATEAVKLKEIMAELEALKQQLALHEKSYQNNVKKIQHAEKNLSKLKDRTDKMEAEYKMSGAEAKMAELAASFDFNSLTTDTAEAESIIQSHIDKNRAKVRVSADLSGEGIEQIEQDEAVSAALAEQTLREFETGTASFHPAGWTPEDQEKIRQSMSEMKESVAEKSETPTPTVTPSK